jgi:two-component system, chemotaxis family, response regulator PixG
MERLTVDQLVHQFQVSHRSHFTGRMDLRSTKGEHWSLYFHLGRLVWATGGQHRFRRWYRTLAQFCPEISPSGIRLRENGIFRTWEYLVLTVLLKRQRVQRDQAIALIKHTVGEILFDILQEIHDINQITSVADNAENLGESLTPIDPEQALIQARHAWETWCRADLAPYSPNMAPVLKRPEELQKQTSTSSYQTLTSLVNGASTLRDVAARMKQSPLTIARSLLPYIHRGLIGFQDLSDLPPPEASAPKVITQTQIQQPLVVCIDDSLQVCQIMHQILTPLGYRFASIQESMQALPTLLELKPNLIFLDLLMPIANGYEICSQVRRVSVLKDIPVVILTGKDGIVDRVRAKMVGASDFLSKPVEPEKVTAIARKYLPPQLPARAQGIPATPYEMGDTTASLIDQSLVNSSYSSVAQPSGPLS